LPSTLLSVFDVTVLGSANLDLVVRTERHPSPGESLLGDDFNEYPGGKGLNQAVAAARSGASTSFVGAIGTDGAGRTLRSVAEIDGLDLSQLANCDGVPSGRAIITVDHSGENSIVVIPGANAAVAAPASISARVVLCQLEVPLDAVTNAFRAGRVNGATTILNPAPATHLPFELLSLCDIVVPNEHEVGLLGGVDALFAAGVSTVVTTRGEQGVEIHTAEGERHSISAPEVSVIDTTGAGDTFCGAFAARLAHGASMNEAARWAIAASALAVGQPGAIPSIPDAGATWRLLSELNS
jgi:ribokinase